jgi:hypothetical protein
MAKKISSSDLFEQEDLFKGVRDSASKTLAVFNELQAELKATAQGLKTELAANTQASTAQLKQFSAASEQANKLMQQAVQIEKLKAQADQQKIKAEQEIVKLQKMQAQETARLAKEQEKAAKLASNEASAYSKLSAELNKARKAYKDLAVTNQENTKEGEELLATITELDTKLKQVDATVGQHQRNVGNYEGATRNLKTELRALTKELMNMETSDPRFQEMTQRAGELKDQISDTQAVVKATAGTAMENFAGATAKAGEIGVAAFQGVEASMQLLGIENENILAGMARLQALAGLSDALKTLGGLGDALTEIRAGFVAAASKMGLFTAAKQVDTVATAANTVAAGANTTATVVQTTATNAANVATKGLTASMLLNPYVLVAAGVAALVYALSKYLDSSDKAAKLEEKRNKEIQKQVDLLGPLQNKMQDEIGSFRAMVGMLSQTNAGSKERSALISEINSKYGTTLKNLSDEKAFQDQLNNSVINFIALQKARYKVEASGEQLKVLFKEEMLLEKQLETEKKLGEKEKERQQKTDDYMGSFDKQNKLNQGRVSNTQKLLEKNRAMQQQLSKESIDGYNKEKQAMEGLGMTGNNNVNTHQNYNQELEKTVDLTKEIQDEETKQITDKEDRAKRELELAAQRRITEINESTATAEQKAQLIKLVEENLATDIKKIYDDYHKDLRDKAIAQAEWNKKNKEELEEEERQRNIKSANDRMAFEDKQNQAKLASLDGEQKKEFEKRLAFGKELEALNQLKFDGAFASQEEYEKAVENLEKKYQADDIEAAKKLEEEKWKTTQEFAQMTTDFLKKQSDERISLIDKEISAAEKQADIYRELAANGNINAQQSLAEQERIIAEGNRRKEREQKRQQRLELANTIYQTYASHAAKDPKTALMNTIKDASLLQAFISSLPMFYDGTEDTGAGGGVDGKGGFHAVLHPHERVIPKSLNDQIGNLTNEQLTRLAMEYQNGRLVGQDVAHSSMDLAILVNEMKDLKEIIKHKPETNIQLGEITQSAMEIVQSTRKGNTTVYNRFKVRK